MSLADETFKKMCIDILENGATDNNYEERPVWKETGEPAYTVYKFGVVNRYELSKEFPILTTRPIGGNDGTGRNAFDELLWIWYLTLILKNKSGEVEGKVWGVTEEQK